MQTRRNLKNINPKNTKKSPTHENTNAKIPCDFGDDRCRIAAARLEKDIFVRTEFRDSPPIVVKIMYDYYHAAKKMGVELDEIPYPYKVHDSTLCPHNYQIDHSRA